MVDEHKQMRTAFSRGFTATVTSSYFPRLGDSYNQLRLCRFLDDEDGYFTIELNINKNSLVLNIALSRRHKTLFEQLCSKFMELKNRINGEIDFTDTGQNHHRIKVIRQWNLYDRSHWAEGVNWVGITGDQVIEIIFPIVSGYVSEKRISMSSRSPKVTITRELDPRPYENSQESKKRGIQ